MRNLFLDANIYLDFYRFGSDDLSEMSKLATLISDEEIRLISNDHLRDEIERNREAVLAKSLNDFRSEKFSIKPPNYCDEISELADLKEKLKAANILHDTIIKETETNISARELRADKLIETIFADCTNIPIENDLIEAAKDRKILGNPPGKGGSLGDSIHWEALLTLGNV